MRQQRADNAEQLRPNEMEESPELFGQILAKIFFSLFSIFFFFLLNEAQLRDETNGGVATVMG